MRYSSMGFRVMRHAAVTAPDHAMDLLSERIPKRCEDVCFSISGDEIGAILDRDESVSMTRDERVEISRRVVLDVLEEVCERAPELTLDWYAVAPVG
jgi:hypothetical protein